MDRSQQQQQKEQPESERRILVVEDDDDLRRLLALILQRDGWVVSPAGDGLSALQAIESGVRFAAVLCDDQIPGPRGIRVLEHARLLNPDARLVLFGGWLSQESRERAWAIGAATVTKGAQESLALLLTVLNET